MLDKSEILKLQLNKKRKMFKFLVSVSGILGLIAVLTSSKEETPKIGGIPRANVNSDFTVYHEKGDDLSNTKRKTTRIINKLVKGGKQYKIGKTGNPYARAAAYKEFDHMYILCESSDRKTIAYLEEFYIGKYKENHNNKNIRGGTGGKMADRLDKYYLYLTVK